MSDETEDKTYSDAELVYAAYNRCPCGAGLAHPRDCGIRGSWDCSDILTGRAVPKDQPGAKMHTGELPFTFYEVLSERQPSANGKTTRPGGVPRDVIEVKKPDPNRLPDGRYHVDVGPDIDLDAPREDWPVIDVRVNEMIQAIRIVESIGASVELTNAVVKLAERLDKLQDARKRQANAHLFGSFFDDRFSDEIESAAERLERLSYRERCSLVYQFPPDDDETP